VRGAEFTHEIHPPSHSQRKNVDAFCQSQSAWELDCAVHSIFALKLYALYIQSGLLESDDRWEPVASLFWAPKWRLLAVECVGNIFLSKP